MWAGLVTEAGEVDWPGYRRVPAKITDERYHYDFVWRAVPVLIPKETLLYAALYTCQIGGELIGMRELDNGGQAKDIMPGHDVSILKWYIRFNKDDAAQIPKTQSWLSRWWD